MRLLVARAATGAALGCGVIVFGDDGIAEIKGMYVATSTRGQGIGSAILKELEAMARTAGSRTIRLETGVRHPEAIALYRRFGYREREEFGSDAPHPSSVFMEKDPKDG
jgi:putative acetyltransferase